MIKRILLGALCVASTSGVVVAEETQALSNSDLLSAIGSVVDEHMEAEHGADKSDQQADKHETSAEAVMLASCDQEAAVYGFSEEKHQMYIDLCIQEKKAQEVIQAAQDEVLSDDSETVLTKK